MPRHLLALLLALALAPALPGASIAQAAAEPSLPIEAVTLHRLYDEYYACGDHREGELKSLGDALGTDCLIQGGLRDTATVSQGFASPFRGDGRRNADWYGWNARVLAPFDGVVVKININPTVNKPGVLGKPPASFIVFEREDGMRVLFAHVQDLQVHEGDRITAGQFVARVGNNGFSRNPHIHVGAWKDGRPYQIRWDLSEGATVAVPAP